MTEETYKFDSFEILCGSDEIETGFIAPIKTMSAEDFVKKANQIVREEWEMAEEYGVFTAEDLYECNVRTIRDSRFVSEVVYKFPKETTDETIRAYRIDLE